MEYTVPCSKIGDSYFKLYLLCDIRNFNDAPLNSPARVDTCRLQDHVSSLYRSE